MGEFKSFPLSFSRQVFPESTIIVSEPALLSCTAGTVIPQIFSLEPVGSLVLTPYLDLREMLRE
jgi:hypothetical protein